MTSDAAAEIYDLAVIGGGINGCGIARDAVGRGWRVFLAEKNDLASGTSSASTKLIHGGLRYLEYYEFRLVREALMEREVLWGVAPHIVWPLRFVLPYHKKLRPRWLLRLGLFLYDYIGGRKKLPPTRSVNLRRDVTGQPLKPDYVHAFEYSDCWVEDSRLVVLNAMDAAARGATIRTRTRCLEAVREDGLWRVTLQDEATGQTYAIRARALVNAAGPWVGDVGQSVLHNNTRAPVRLVQGSHIVVPKLYDHPGCYIFQNDDRRIFFVIPYEQDFTLIGTTDQDYKGDPADVRASDEEIAYLCRSASDYLAKAITPDMVVWTYSGVRPLYNEDSDTAAQAATRDYVLKLDAPDGAPALLSVYGGKITTFRRLAESALAQLAPHLPPATGKAAGWTGKENLPGGDFPMQGFPALKAEMARRYPFLSDRHLHRLLRAYGTRVTILLGDARSQADLGETFGADITEAELRYLVQYEWVRTSQDILWRRSKLGLRISKDEAQRIETVIAALTDRLPVLA
ncbi:glycerol-3-phosphate dehydrogenase [Acidisoma silvae]|uniref:Glycerol-3-phosphate dehydrogenase n=1 Tax=Acidisoma silvae TaxID=2802396 RepID=A0A963YQ01_9PROT|nr:glycerol-3-phosphate dehydrogenase [Acidisoma silvae]MCB8874656.1 glycerol-3-phosphate dehydrogenase [Acidisoma silvae]